MNKKLHIDHSRLIHHFRVGWIVFTLAILCVMLFFGWEHYRLQKSEKIQSNANYLAYKLDESIENLLETGSSISYQENEFKTCQHKLADKLRSLVFNHPNISGIIISDNQNTPLCASTETSPMLPPPDQANRALFGPMTFSQNDTDVYLLQQRFGQYRLGIFIIKPLLEDYLRKYSRGFDFVGLYDNKAKKMLLQIGNPSAFHDLLHANQTTQSGDNSEQIILPLQTINNIELLISAHPLGYMRQLILTMSLMTLPFLLLSWLFYSYCIRLISNRYSLTSALGNALKQHEFYPAYQAVHDETNNRFCGAEVLIRWHLDNDEVIMPDYFIVEAENSGYIIPITLQIIEKAFQECHGFLADHPSIYMSFNLSPHHFKDPQFFSQFYQLSTHFSIQPSQIMFELTERELFDQNDEEVVKQMNELRLRGFLLAIDDFGTGQANINYLQHFPFNYLKIDKLFIHAIGTGAITATLTQTIILMAKALEINIIAEGVETQEQLDYLRAHEVHLIQGWFYARAMPFQDFIKLFDKKGNSNDKTNPMD
jgi:sensor c-di-GMP phosphodiesterase-like protein